MNIEYMKLSNDSTLVTDEKGKITIRNDEVTNKTLIIENKIESLENKIVSVTKKINEYKGNKFVSKCMLIIMPTILVFVTLIGYAIGNITLAFKWFFSGSLAVIPAEIIWGIEYPISKKKLKKFEIKLDNAEKLKSECENELEEEKKINLKMEEKIYNPISLVKETKTELSFLDDRLETEYNHSVQTKPKVLVLSRNPNNKK